MNHMRNTDEVSTEPNIPRPEHMTQAVREVIDIHIYHTVSSEADTRSIESTLQDVEATVVPEYQRKQTTPRRTRSPRRFFPVVLFVLIACLVLILVAGSLAYLFLFPATVTITIIPTSQQIQTTGNVTLITGKAETINDAIPGRLLSSITLSQAQTSVTTGRTQQEAQPGRGTITFYNAALYPQTMVASTLLTGADGKQVVTDYAVTVPAARYPTFGEASVTAHAVQPGTEGNITEGDIYGLCCLLNISAVNSAFIGGQEAQTYQSVSKPDIERAVSSLQTTLTQAVTAALQTQIQTSETLITPPSCQQNSSSDHQPGDKATQVQVSMTQVCTGIAYETRSFQTQITHLQTQAATTHQREHYQIAGEVHATIHTVTPSTTPGIYTLAVQSTGTWIYHFSQRDLTHLAVTIAGKQSKKATQLLLHTPGIQQVSLSNSVQTLPTDSQNIHFLFLI